jgi:hypothetical protein
LICLSEKHRAGIRNVQALAEFANDGVRFGQVLAQRPFALDKKGYRVQSEAVDAEIQPEPDDLPDGLEDGRIVVVNIRLMAEKAVPVIRLGDGIPSPVGDLGIDRDDGDALVASVGIAPHLPIAAGIVAGTSSLLKPGMLVGGVIENQFDDDADPASMGGVEECLKILQ